MYIAGRWVEVVTSDRGLAVADDPRPNQVQPHPNRCLLRPDRSQHDDSDNHQFWLSNGRILGKPNCKGMAEIEIGDFSTQPVKRPGSQE